MAEQIMLNWTDPNSVRKIIKVQAAQAVAWQVFTEQMATWWPLAVYKIGKTKAVDAIMAYDWPGNVRELENALERAVVLTKGEAVSLSTLPAKITERRAEPLLAERAHVNPTLEVIEQAYITWVLQSEGGNKTRAAEVLGIDPSTLYRKLSKYETGVKSADAE